MTLREQIALLAYPTEAPGRVLPMAEKPGTNPAQRIQVKR